MTSSKCIVDSTQWVAIPPDELHWLVAEGIANIRRAALDFFSLASCRPVMIEFDASHFIPTAFTTSYIEAPTSLRGAARKRQAEYFFGRAAARLAMRNCTAPFMSVCTGHMREPVWPAGIVGSISHYNGVAVAVAMPSTRCKGIGIDAEEILSAEVVKEVASIALDRIEAMQLRASGMDPTMAFTLAFSAKESFFKGAFAEVGRFIDFSAVRILLIDRDRQVLRIQVRENLSNIFRLGEILEVHYAQLPNSAVLTCFHYYAAPRTSNLARLEK